MYILITRLNVLFTLFSLLRPFEKEVLFQCSIFADGLLWRRQRRSYALTMSRPHISWMSFALVEQSWISVKKTSLGNRLYIFDMIQQFFCPWIKTHGEEETTRTILCLFCSIWARYVCGLQKRKHAYQAN